MRVGGHPEEHPNLGHKMRMKGGYFPTPPNDKLQDVRTEMMLTLIDAGIDIEVQHHEVGGAGQAGRTVPAVRVRVPPSSPDESTAQG